MNPPVVSRISMEYARALPQHKAAVDAIDNLETASARMTDMIYSAMTNMRERGHLEILETVWIDYKAAARAATVAVDALRAATQASIPGGGVA